jgi:parvulin-like peptidyl-prolyl isomerase
LTDEFLESHFHQNKRQLDGTELRVAHLLLKFSKGMTSDQLDALSEKARSIADQIAKTSLTWDAAVAKHSQSPARNSGGTIGWIQIDGPMPRSFTQAAFELSLGQISEPVSTRFGIHLIKCVEVKEGKLGWRDIIDEVKKSASRAYFDAIVKQHRPEVTIKTNKQASDQ